MIARVAFAAPYTGWPVPGDEEVWAALETLCDGLRSFSELEQAARHPALVRMLEARLCGKTAGRLDRVAPERIRLAGGRQVKVHYSVSGPPWIASRLQDFFGMREAPRVAEGQVPVVVHLLAPNQRPVQMTTDLEGFWQRLYPRVRSELRRRYPKHAWPEKPGM